MQGNISNERRQEILLQAREERERRRAQGDTVINPSKSYDVSKADENRKKIMASILNNKYQGTSQESYQYNDEGNSSERNQYTNENQDKQQERSNEYQQINNMRQYNEHMNSQDTNGADIYGVEHLIQEKVQAGDGNMFSLEEIKQRLNEKLERNSEINSRIKQQQSSITQPIIENSRVKPPTQGGGDSLNYKDSFNLKNQPLNPFETRKLPQEVYQQDSINDISQRERESQRLLSDQSLYEKKRSHSYTQRRSEEEYIKESKFSFKPTINEMPKEIYGDSQNLKVSRQEQWERLLKDKIEQFTLRENLKILSQQQEINEKCSFVPQINEISKLITVDKIIGSNVSERLFKEGAKKQEEREELRRKYDDAQNYPFQPDVRESVMGLKGDAAFTRPIYERVDEVVKERQDLRLQLQIKNQNDQQYTFKPELNSKSEQIAKQKLKNKSVVERLLDDIKQKEERKSKMIETQNESVSQMCPFQPSINASNRTTQDGDDSFISQKQRQDEFVNRQHLVADLIKERLEQKIKEIYDSDTFTPYINPISNYLVAADEERANETEQEKVNRLFQQDQMKRQITKEQIQKAYYDKFSFQPEINNLSKKIARKRSLDSLAFDKDKCKKKKVLKEKVEELKMKECYFQPQTNKSKKYDGVKSYYSKETIDTALKESKENKIKQLEQIRKQMEYEEMKECTFNPITKQLDRVDYEEKLQGMRGITSFLKQKELLKKQAQLTKQREDEVFQIKDQSQFRDSNKTVPMPFKLSKGNGPSSKKIREELLQECLEQCTFQPQTNESRNKEIIKRIISNQQNPYEMIPEENDNTDSRGEEQRGVDNEDSFGHYPQYRGTQAYE